MNIEVKSIHAAQMIDTMACPYEAELFLNGKPAAHISYDGRESGPRIVPMTGADIAQLTAAEQYCKQQAALTKSTSKTAATEVKQTLSLTVDGMLEAHLESLNRQMRTTLQDLRSAHSILYGNVKTGIYKMHPLPQSVDAYLATDPGDKELLEILKKEVAPKLRADDSILNHNIPLRLLLKAFSEETKLKTPRKRVVQPPDTPRKKH
jgi:hypothetical protein